jgi:quinol monooxygenase YgiN
LQNGCALQSIALQSLCYAAEPGQGLSAFTYRARAVPIFNHPDSGKTMATQDRCVSIAPYFKVSTGQLGAFKALCEQFVEKTQNEPKALYYGFSFDGDHVHCREGYADAEGLLAHLDNVGELLSQALKIAEITRLEVHGAEMELVKLREPLAGYNPQFFTLECGFRR